MAKSLTKKKKFGDELRWVVAEIKEHNNTSAQLPLPITINNIRAMFDVGYPMVVPFNFVIRGLESYCPGYKVDRKKKEIEFKADPYEFMYEEIPAQYQDTEGIFQFLKDANNPQHEMFAEYQGLKLGIDSIPQYMKNRDKDVAESVALAKEKLAEKAAEQEAEHEAAQAEVTESEKVQPKAPKEDALDDLNSEFS